MKKSIRHRLTALIAVTGLAGVMVAAVMLMGGLSFFGSAEADCSTRWYSRTCQELPSTVTVTATKVVTETATVTAEKTVTVTVTSESTVTITSTVTVTQAPP